MFLIYLRQNQQLKKGSFIRGEETHMYTEKKTLWRGGTQKTNQQTSSFFLEVRELQSLWRVFLPHLWLVSLKTIRMVDWPRTMWPEQAMELSEPVHQQGHAGGKWKSYRVFVWSLESDEDAGHLENSPLLLLSHDPLYLSFNREFCSLLVYCHH